MAAQVIELRGRHRPGPVPPATPRPGRDARDRGGSQVVRTILHVDLDCFFVSVERVLNPSLAQVPVIVGGSAESRGVVCSASREARAAGVHAGLPTSVARRLCPEAVFLPGRARLYARAAAAAFKVLREFSPLLERASIDEAYLDVTEVLPGWPSAFDLAAAIQAALAERLGLPCSVGIASNKVVAKVACGKAKPEGILEVWPGYEEPFLAPLAVEDLPGIGPVLAQRLRLFGLRTVGQLARMNAGLLESTFGSAGTQLARRARGVGSELLSCEDEPPRSIGSERTFPRDLRATAVLRDELQALASQVAHRLRRHGLRGRTVTLKLRTADFRTTARSCTLPLPTDKESEIAGVAGFLLDEMHAEGTPVRLLGVGVSGLGGEPAQVELFPEALPIARRGDSPSPRASQGLIRVVSDGRPPGGDVQ